jgi:hypothetical protein
MKYITDNSDIQGLLDFFPSLSQYQNSRRVKLCAYRPVPINAMQFNYYNFDVIVLAIYGDYEQIHIDEVIALANIKKPTPHYVIVPSVIDAPCELPANVHWLSLKSMFAVFTKNNKFITQDRPTVKKQFVSLNHRYTWFRQELFYYFYENNLLDSSYFSYAGDDRELNQPRRLFELGNSIIGNDRYNKLDKEALYTMLPFKNFVEDNPPARNQVVKDFRNVQNLYNTAAVAIESETYMETFLDYNPGITEKTIRPLIMGNPFLVYNNRGTLKTLRDMGFETFGSIIDESYDDIASPQHRWEAILEQVKQLSTVDPTVLLGKVNDVLEHNQEHILVTMVKQLEQDDQMIDNLIRSLL